MSHARAPLPVAATSYALALLLGLALSPARLAHALERPTLAVPLASGPIQVDGVLDEPAWRSAGVATQFQLMIPREGQVPSESTEVYVLRDGVRVVFGFRCFAKRKPHSGLAARDGVLDGDHISVHLDTDGDGQRGYIFGVNPYGVQVDGILTGDADFKWDGVWDAAAHREEGVWTAEISVPFRIMRISANVCGKNASTRPNALSRLSIHSASGRPPRSTGFPLLFGCVSNVAIGL